MRRATKRHQVKCLACGKVIGIDPDVKTVEKCISCVSEKHSSTTKQTVSSSYAKTKKGPANDLGDLGKYNFRSGWERNFARWLTVKEVTWTYERVSFTFKISPITGLPYKRRPWIYIPDFYDVDSDILYEIKGYLRSEDRSKVGRLKANYPDDFRKLVAVCSKSNKKATNFYRDNGVPVIFIEDIRAEYSQLALNNFWEER